MNGKSLQKVNKKETNILLSTRFLLHVGILHFSRKSFVRKILWGSNVNVSCYEIEFRAIHRSSRQEVFCKKGVLRNFAKLTGKHLCQSLFFNIVAGLRPTTFLKKRLGHRCFSLNFAKFLRTPFLTEHLRWLPLYLEVKNQKKMIKGSFITKTRGKTEAVVQRYYLKKGVLRNLAKFTRKRLFQSFFFNKVTTSGLQLY